MMAAMARPRPAVAHPNSVATGSIWAPKWPRRMSRKGPLRIVERVDRAAGTHYVVENVEPVSDKVDRRVINWENLVRFYTQTV
jgi:hypothetical protein